MAVLLARPAHDRRRGFYNEIRDYWRIWRPYRQQVELIRHTPPNAMFEAFCQRYECGATMLTSSPSFDEWTELRSLNAGLLLRRRRRMSVNRIRRLFLFSPAEQHPDSPARRHTASSEQQLSSPAWISSFHGCCVTHPWLLEVF